MLLNFFQKHKFTVCTILPLYIIKVDEGLSYKITLIILIHHRRPKIFVEDSIFSTSKLNGRWWILDLPVYSN